MTYPAFDSRLNNHQTYLTRVSIPNDAFRTERSETRHHAILNWWINPSSVGVYAYGSRIWSSLYATFLALSSIGRPGARPINGISTEFEIPSKCLECSGLKYVQPITAKFCTHHDSDTVVTCAKQNFVVIGRIFYEQKHYKFPFHFEVNRNIVSGTGARTHIDGQCIWHVSLQISIEINKVVYPSHRI